MKIVNSISFFIFTVCAILLFCSIFMVDKTVEDEFVVGKMRWFHWAVFLLSICTLCYTIYAKDYKCFPFSIVDGLLLIYLGVIITTYNWVLNPVPEKLYFMGQLLILWILLRFIFIQIPKLYIYFIGVIIIVGIIEAVLGIFQLNGIISSNHTHFNLTGDFYNPGPFSGFLSIIFPLCLDTVFKYSKYKRSKGLQIGFFLYYIGWIGLLTIIVVLPAGMSRTAWIATFVSCVWICWKECLGLQKIKLILKEHRFLSIALFFIVCILITGISFFMYQFKQASADGRLFLWKITTKALAEQSWKGVGLGGFRVAYANTQAKYFASGKGSDVEMAIAGYPDCAFNDYLHISLEQGCFGVILFVAFLFYSLYQGIKGKQSGVAGALIAFMVFCFASYPLQLVEFWIILIVLLCISNINQNSKPTCCNMKRLLITISGLVLCSGYFVKQNESYYEKYKEWHILKTLNNSRLYKISDNGYINLAKQMKHRPELLFETALCLNRNKKYGEANELLYDALKLTNNPLIYYVLANNEQILGNYSKAEDLLLYVANMLPERVYPHYLLLKLYTESMSVEKEKIARTANIVLTKEAKVSSKAVLDMREYALKVLYSLK